MIRRTEASDATGLYKLYSGNTVIYYTLQLPLPSLADWQNRLNTIPNNVYSLVALLGNEVVGNIALTIHPNPRRRHTGELAMAVKDQLQGQGIGSSLLTAALDLATNWLNITRLELTVYTDNQQAIALYQKFGFIIEGEAKNFALRDGGFVNAYYMAKTQP